VDTLNTLCQTDSAEPDLTQPSPYLPGQASYLCLEAFASGSVTPAVGEAHLPSWARAPYAPTDFAQIYERLDHVQSALEQRLHELVRACRQLQRDATLSPLVQGKDIEELLYCRTCSVERIRRPRCRLMHLCPFCAAREGAEVPYRDVAALTEALLVRGETVYVALDSGDVLHRNSRPLPPARRYLRAGSRLDQDRLPEAVTLDGSGTLRAVLRAAWPLPPIAGTLARATRRAADVVPVLRVRYLRICTGEPPQPLPFTGEDESMYLVRRVEQLTDLVPLVGALRPFPGWLFASDIPPADVIRVLSWLGKANLIVRHGALSPRSANHAVLGGAVGASGALARFNRWVSLRYDMTPNPSAAIFTLRRLAALSSRVTLRD